MKEGKTDWADIHGRIEALGTVLEKGYSQSPGDVKETLKVRARVLAQEPQEARGGDSLEVLEFMLASERYAMELQFIREVYPIKDYTPLPGAPVFVLGLVNVRGQIISVIDIKKFFDVPDKGIGDLNKVIIICDENMEFGILADAIVGVRLVPVSQIQPTLPTLTGIREKFLKGVAAEGMVILDAGKILSDQRVVVNEFV